MAFLLYPTTSGNIPNIDNIFAIIGNKTIIKIHGRVTVGWYKVYFVVEP